MEYLMGSCMVGTSIVLWQRRYWGRPLKADEVVHHMDFNKRNNAAWNIMIFSSQSDHAKYHAQLNAFFQKGVIPSEIVPEVMPYEVRAT